MIAIAAVSPSWGIGSGDDLLFHIKGDMKFFRETTSGGTVILGRKTLDTFPGGKPLPNRRHIVISRNPDFVREGVEAAHSVEEALALVSDEDPDRVFVIGGGQIYEQLLPYCDKAYLTHVDTDLPATVYFPNLSHLTGWEVTSLSEPVREGEFIYRFATWEFTMLNHLLA